MPSSKLISAPRASAEARTQARWTGPGATLATVKGRMRLALENLRRALGPNEVVE